MSEASEMVTRLKSKSRKIEQFRDKQKTLEGKRGGILSTLTSRFKVETLEEAKKLHKQKLQELEQLEEEGERLEERMNAVIRKVEDRK
jgi:hypothetical protein